MEKKKSKVVDNPLNKLKKRMDHGKVKELCPHCIYINAFYSSGEAHYECGHDAIVHPGAYSYAFKLNGKKPCLRLDWLDCPYNYVNKA